MPTAARAPSRAANATSRAAAPAPLRGPAAPPRRHLRVVAPPGARRPRLSPALGVVATSILFVGLFALAFVHTLLVQGQIHLDQLDAKVAEQQTAYSKLRLDVGELESPERVVAVAQDRLGMVSPDELIYLAPDEPAEVDADEPDAGSKPDSADLAKGEDSWLTTKPLLESTP